METLKNKQIGAYKFISVLPSSETNSMILVQCVWCKHKKETRKYDFLRSVGICSNCGHAGNKKRKRKTQTKHLFKKRHKEQVCSVCGVSDWNGEPLTMDIDHIIPLSVGGKDTIDNLRFICPNCHRQKTEKERKDKLEKKRVF